MSRGSRSTTSWHGEGEGEASGNRKRRRLRYEETWARPVWYVNRIPPILRAPVDLHPQPIQERFSDPPLFPRLTNDPLEREQPRCH